MAHGEPALDRVPEHLQQGLAAFFNRDVVVGVAEDRGGVATQVGRTEQGRLARRAAQVDQPAAAAQQPNGGRGGHPEQRVDHHMEWPVEGFGESGAQGLVVVVVVVVVQRHNRVGAAGTGTLLRRL